MAQHSSKRIRILHIVYPLVRGGIETWLLHVLNRYDPTKYEMHFVTHRLGCPLDDEYRSKGAKLFQIIGANRPIGHVRSLIRVIREHGPYDIVHSHVHHSGIELRIVATQKVPARIAHAHNTAPAWRQAPLPERLAIALTHHWIRRYATHGLACSEQAAFDFFGPDWKSSPKFHVLHYGIPVERFRQDPDSGRSLRDHLGILPKDKIVALVGRLAVQKNHDFALRIAKKVVAVDSAIHFVFAGDGPLRSQLEQKVKQFGLERNVHFLGAVANVPELMKSAFDLLLLPSLWEGLGLVAVEAQAANLPAIVSTAVPQEAVVIPELVTRLDLAAGADAWAQAIIRQLAEPRRTSPSECLRKIENSDFNIEVSVRRLLEFYEWAVGER